VRIETIFYLGGSMEQTNLRQQNMGNKYTVICHDNFPGMLSWCVLQVNLIVCTLVLFYWISWQIH